MKRMAVILTLGIFAGALPLMAQREKKVEKSFSQDEMRIKLILAGCDIQKSPDSKIHVSLVYTYEDDVYEYRMEDRGRYLYLNEKYHDNNPRGHAHWTVKVPAGVEIDFNSATGSLSIRDVKDLEIEGNTGTGDIDILRSQGEFDVNTGTGRVEALDSRGEFELNSGTGRVMIEDCAGNFDANSGTGNVKGINITIEYDAEFGSGTGEAEVIGPHGKDYDLTLRSGTDDAILDMDGQDLVGRFELSCDERRGRIISDVQFDDEEKYRNGGDNWYIRKIVERGGSKPRYFVKTGTGKAVLKL